MLLPVGGGDIRADTRSGSEFAPDPELPEEEADELYSEGWWPMNCRIKGVERA